MNMKRLFVALMAMLMIAGSTVGSAAQTPEAPDLKASSATQMSEAVDPGIGDTSVYYDESGNPAGNVTIESIERGWEEYDEFYEPESGMEFVAVVLTVESTVGRGAIDVEMYDFKLQTSAGQLLTPGFTSSETADPPLLDEPVSLAADDTETFTVVFEVFEDEPMAHLFWEPEFGFLITVAQLEGE